MKISEIIRLLKADGWVLKRTTGSHRLCPSGQARAGYSRR